MWSNRVISREAAFALDLEARVKLEEELTDAEEKLIKPRVNPYNWDFDSYRKQSPWRTHMFNSLGPLAGKTILDLGCGYHPTPIYFAHAGARMVYANEVSHNALANVREMAERAKVSDRIRTLACPAERLNLEDESIDLIHGEAVLHHLALPLAGAEIARVLKKGGKAVFKDPLGHNPILEFARDYLPYKWKKNRKGTDRPLRFEDIEEFGSFFASYSYRGFGLFLLIETLIWGRGNPPTRKVVNTLDSFVLRAFPRLQRYCRFIVTCVEK